MQTPCRFGVLGTGNIAAQFARDVSEAQRSEIAAVGSRNAESAAGFGRRFGLDPARCHGSYEAMLADPGLDAVYVSLPNHLHETWTARALESGKHVLCEKPLAMSPGEAQRMFGAAEKHDRLLMEAFMYRCHPLTHAVRDAVRRGAIGTLKMIRASFCFRVARTAGNIRFDPSTGGGALMDIGCYGLDFCRLIIGRPPSPESPRLLAHRHDTGVDDVGAVILQFPADPHAPPALSGPVTATLTFGMTLQLDNTAHLGGADGHLQVPVPWKPPQRGAAYVLGGQIPPKQDAVVNSGKASEQPPRGPEPRAVAVDAAAPLYALEADAFADAVAGRADLPITPAESLDNARLLAALRRQL